MPVEFVRDMINYERLIGEGSSQTMVNGDIVAGERNPEFGRILCMDGKAVITSTETMYEKVVVEGRVLFDILYSSADEDGNIYRVTANSIFTHTLQVPGTQDSMSCKIVTDIEHMEHELVSSKKIKVNAVIDIKGTVYEKESVEAITDILGDEIQLLRENTYVNEFVAGSNGEIIVKSSLTVPDTSGEARSVLKDKVYIHKKDIGVQDGRVVISGAALVYLLYEASEEKGVAEAWEDIYFTHEMDMPDVRSNMRCDVDFTIGDVISDITDDENGERRCIAIELSVGAEAKVYATRQIETIADAYSSMQRYELSSSSIKVISYFGENKDSQSIREKVVIPSDVSGVNIVRSVTANPVITEIKMLENKVSVEGVLECSMIYTETGEDPQLVSYMEEIPFKAAVDMPNSKIHMLADAEVVIEELSYERLSDREVDLRMLIQVSAKAYSREDMDVITDVEENELPDNIINMPSLVIYVVQNNDTLWKIAKRYATTVDDIAKMNDIQDADNIYPGMKLVIPKKTFMK